MLRKINRRGLIVGAGAAALAQSVDATPQQRLLMSGGDWPRPGSVIDEKFTTGQYFPGPITSDIVDTRASSKTLTNISGNFFTVGVNALPISNAGMLIEPAGTNIFLQSGSISNAAWTKGAVTTGTGDTGPSGNTTTKVVPTVTNTQHYFLQGAFTVASASTMVNWQVMKADGYNWVALSIFDITHHLAWFNISTGAVGTVQSGVTAFTPISLSNGYWLIGIKYTISGTSVFGTVWPATADNVNANANWSGDGTSGIYADVGQLAVATVITSYIPTTTGSATRNADSAVIQRIGIGRIMYTFDNGTTQTVSGINPALMYTIPTNLNRALITRITGYPS